MSLGGWNAAACNLAELEVLHNGQTLASHSVVQARDLQDFFHLTFAFTPQKKSYIGTVQEMYRNGCSSGEGRVADVLNSIRVLGINRCDQTGDRAHTVTAEVNCSDATRRNTSMVQTQQGATRILNIKEWVRNEVSMVIQNSYELYSRRDYISLPPSLSISLNFCLFLSRTQTHVHAHCTQV